MGSWGALVTAVRLGERVYPVMLRSRLSEFIRWPPSNIRNVMKRMYLRAHGKCTISRSTYNVKPDFITIVTAKARQCSSSEVSSSTLLFLKLGTLLAKFKGTSIYNSTEIPPCLTFPCPWHYSTILPLNTIRHIGVDTKRTLLPFLSYNIKPSRFPRTPSPSCPIAVP
jgi:hypothetical protein